MAGIGHLVMQALLVRRSMPDERGDDILLCQFDRLVGRRHMGSRFAVRELHRTEVKRERGPLPKCQHTSAAR